MMSVVGLMLVAYLLGSTPTSLLLARLRGIDLRSWGSGNLGATNLYRAAGLGLASLCTIVDVGKGYVPARFFAEIDGVEAPQLALAYGVAAVLGHVFSVWVKFRGGKGVATGAGVYLALAPAAAGLAAAVWLIVMLTVRIASAASLSGATVFPLFVWLTGHKSDFVFWSSIPLIGFIWWTHRSNIRRLLAGREPRTARGSGAPEADRQSSEAASEA
jgi:glycerol-3-phosphate acyltransferase PlsY